MWNVYWKFSKKSIHFHVCWHRCYDVTLVYITIEVEGVVQFQLRMSSVLDSNTEIYFPVSEVNPILNVKDNFEGTKTRDFVSLSPR